MTGDIVVVGENKSVTVKDSFQNIFDVFLESRCLGAALLNIYVQCTLYIFHRDALERAVIL